MTYAAEKTKANAEQREKLKKAYAREGEAEFWDRAFCAALGGYLAQGLNDRARSYAEEAADASCKRRRQARRQRWEEENGGGR